MEIEALIDQNELVTEAKFVLAYIVLMNFTSWFVRLILFETTIVWIEEDATKFVVARVVIITIVIVILIFFIIVLIFEVFFLLDPEESSAVLTLQRMMHCCGSAKRIPVVCVISVLSLDYFSFFLDFNRIVSEHPLPIRVSCHDFKVEIELVAKISVILLDSL